MTQRDKGGSVTGRWSSTDIVREQVRKAVEAGDPFRRPWVSGRRPWQFKDRPRIVVFDEKSNITPEMWRLAPDIVTKDGRMADFKISKSPLFSMDFAEAERKILAHYDGVCKDQLEASCERAYRNIEGKTRLENFRRGIP